MKKTAFLIFFQILTLFAFSQRADYTSVAIHKDSPKIVAWAVSAEVERGYINIMDTTVTFTQGGVTSNKAFYGTEGNCIGKSDGQFVSLGDGGSAVLQFSSPITNGEGADFAVFENAIFAPPYQTDTTFVELAFVEVSSNGVDYARFPAVSNMQYQTQIGTFENVKWEMYENFAGLFPVFYGCQFDLDDIENADVDVNNITYVKLIDAVGSINPEYATFDSYGNIVNDPFPTPFYSCGFDLDAVGVIHSLNSINQQFDKKVQIYPNPVSDYLEISAEAGFYLKISNVSGQIVYEQNCVAENPIRLDVSQFSEGLYFVNFIFDDYKEVKKLQIVK